jgi:hypothetical protein
VDRSGSGSYPTAGFGISGVEPSGSATTELINWLVNIYLIYMYFNIKMKLQSTSSQLDRNHIPFELTKPKCYENPLIQMLASELTGWSERLF